MEEVQLKREAELAVQQAVEARERRAKLHAEAQVPCVVGEYEVILLSLVSTTSV